MQIIEQWIDTPEGRLFAKRWLPTTSRPSAVPIILLHDSLGSVELWRSFPAHLAAATGRPVIAYDRLGFGRSGARHDLVEVDFIHQEAQRSFQYVWQALELNDFVIIGHSVGGGMAVGIAAQYADHCQALVTMAAQAFVEGLTLDGIRSAQAMFSTAGQLERLAKYHGDKANWVLSAWIDRWLDPVFKEWNLGKDLRRVRCPLLVLHGERDEYGSIQHPALIAELAAGRATKHLGPWGHVMHREEPDVVVKLISDFLSTLHET